MVNSEQRPGDGQAQAAGLEGEGQDAYPTYRDGPVSPHVTTTTKPTDVGLSNSKKTNSLPMLIGLLAFAAVILVAVIGALSNVAETTPEAMTSGDAAAPTPGAASIDSAQPATLDNDREMGAATGPGEVEAAPGPVDVPGGANTTTPTNPAPAD